MEGVQKLHDLLLQRRTQIRNHKNTQQLLRKCWKLAPHDDLESMVLEEYENLYSMLLYEMTICWEDELNGAILAKMWQRDASSFQDLNFDRFCCSLFFFVEMWVDEVNQVAYEEILSHIRTIMSGLEPMEVASSRAATSTFKPTLESFSSALDSEKAMEELNMNIGKSIFFDAAQYYHHFGAPKIPIERSPSPRGLVAAHRKSWGAKGSPSKQPLDARRGQHSPLRPHSPSSWTFRVHLSSSTPRNRPTSSSPSSRVTTARPGVSTIPTRKNDDAHSSSSDPQFLLTGKSALSPSKRRS